MSFTPLEDDVSQVSKLGNHPKSDNGLSTSGLKAWFDKAGETIKKYLNNTLIPELESRFSTLESWARGVDDKINDFVVGAGFLSTSGGSMKGTLDMGEHKITGVSTPTDDGDAANKAFVTTSISNATTSTMQEVNSLVDGAKTYADGKYFSVEKTLAASSWVGGTQSVYISGVTVDTTDIYASPATGSYEAYTECGVRATAQTANGVTFTCEDTPSSDLTVCISVVKKG